MICEHESEFEFPEKFATKANILVGICLDPRKPKDLTASDKNSSRSRRRDK